MYWFSKIKRSPPSWQWGILPGVVIFIMAGCINPENTADFETDLISLSKVLDSAFQDGHQDSIQSVTKTIQVSGNDPESKQFPEYNIQNDLEILKDFDIATPRWADFVQTSTRDSAGLTLIHYTLKNKRAPVKAISFVKDGNDIQSLRVFSRKKSAVSEQKITIKWRPGISYTVKNESKLIFRKPNTFTMKVDY